MNIKEEDLKPQIQVAPGGVPSIYVEGVNQMMVGFPVSRLTFYHMAERGPQSPVEIRHGACELVMPTSALIEMARLILSNLSANKNVIESAKSEWYGKVDQLMATLNVPTESTDK